jgi:hypothetical protein
MRFLEHTLIWEWCREHGFALDEPEGPVAPRLADDPALRHRERSVHAAAGDPERARRLAHKLAASLGDWDECLVWATDWDVWSNKEDWPRYYAWRGGFGERRSLRTAPAHVFQSDDAALLQELLTHVLECGWDVTVLPSMRGRSTGRRLRTSHDEWIELQAVSPIGFSVAAG